MQVAEISRHFCVIIRACAVSQWETLHCSLISHWLSPYPEWSLYKLKECLSLGQHLPCYSLPYMVDHWKLVNSTAPCAGPEFSKIESPNSELMREYVCVEYITTALYHTRKWSTWSWIHATKGLQAYKTHTSILKIYVVLTWKIMNRSGHNFAHVTTAQLSWHV